MVDISRNTVAARAWPASAADAIIELVVESGDAASLARAVDEFCAKVETQGEGAVAVIRIDGVTGQWPGDVTVQDANRWERAVRRLERVPAVTVAVASGPCGGPALDLLLVADYRIAAPDLALSCPVNDGQFWPGMGLYRLVQQVGAAKARHLVLWGRRLDAARCAALGLIDEVSNDLPAALSGALEMIGRQPGSEVAIRRKLLLEATASAFEDALGAHLAACDRELRRIRPRIPTPA